MAETTSKIRILFDGTSKGVVKAAKEAQAAISGLDKDSSKLAKAADKTGSGLVAISKGFAALGAAGGAVNVIGATAGALTQLAPAALLLPGALLGGAAAMGTFKIATAGMGDALKAGLSGDMEKFAEATQDMAPAMQDAAKAVVAFKPQIDDLKKSVQGAFWEDFGGQVTALGNRYLPILNRGMTGVSKSLGTMAFEASAAMNNNLFSGAVVRIFDNTAKSIDNMSPALGKVLKGFTQLGAVGSDYLPRLGTAIDDVATKFSNWVSNTSDEQLKAMIDGAVRGFQDLGGIVKNIGSSIGSIFTGLGGQISSPLASLRELTGQVAEFLKTVEAQEGLRALGDTLRVVGDVVGRVVMTALRELMPTLVELAPVAQEVARTLGDLLVGALETLGPIVRGVASVLGEFPGVVGLATTAVVGFVVAMKAIKTVNATAEFLGIGDGILGIGDKAKGAEGKVGGLHGKLSLIKSLGAAAALGAVAVALDDINTKSAGGAQNLQGVEENLNDLVGAGKQLAELDFGGIFADINGELTTWRQNIQSGQGAFGQFLGYIKRQLAEKLPPLTFDVDTGPGERQVATFIRGVNGNSPSVNINGNTNGAAFALRTILEEIAAGKGEIIIDGQPMPAQDALAFVVGLINNSNGEISINGQTKAAGDALAEILGRTNSSTGTVTIDGNRDPATGKVQQAVSFADGSKGTITVDGNPVPANGKTTGAVRFADGSRGTITIDGNQTPANGKINATVTYADGRVGTIQVDANTGAANSAIQGIVNRWNGYTININTVVSSRIGGLAAGGPVFGPGSGTSDTAGLFALSRGEHVLTAREVAAAGGHAAIFRMRRALLGGGAPPRMTARQGRAAGGGSITSAGALSVPTPQVAVSVRIGERDITDIVRTEIASSSRATRRTVGMGAGTTF